MCYDENMLEKELLKHQDKKYRDFQIKLVPVLSLDSMIGVRTPDLRAIAKTVSKDKELCEKFVNELPHKYFEENQIHFFVVSEIKDFKTCIEKVEKFLPYVDCWPVCDQSRWHDINVW